MTPIQALLLGIMIGAGLVLISSGLQVGELARRDRAWLAEIFDNLWVNRHVDDSLRAPVVETVEADVVEEEPSSLPLDPDNPPFPRVYRQRPGRPDRYCHCHGRPLSDGEVVLFWPNPDIDGAFWLVCAPEGTTV